MAPQTVTPAERIRDLSDINNDVAAMLSAAGQAVNALTNRSLHPSDEDTDMTDDASNTIEAHKKAFMDHTEAYFTGLQAIFARLRRQAYALEEAGIITPDSTALGNASARPAPQQGNAQQGAAQASTQRSDADRIKNGGLGNFDVGYLNSRGNKVGEGKEAELIQEARELLEEVLARGERNG